MGSFTLVRLAYGVLVVLGVGVLVAVMIHLAPGDPVVLMVGDAPAAPEQLDAIRRNLGLDRPLLVQIIGRTARILRGDLGRSLRSNRPVADDLVRVLPLTLTLAVAAMSFGIVIGVPAGVVAAVRRGQWIDSQVSALAVLGFSMPTFWTGTLLIAFFAVYLRWLPTSGQEGARTLVLPALALGWYAAGALTRLVRSGMLEVLQQEYVTVARAKGLRETLVVVRHALRNALIPAVTLATVQFGTLLSGAVVVETVFGRDGLGRLIVVGILEKDFPVVQGAVLVTAVIYTLTNLLADLLYLRLDPRLRYA
jgi:ABC-type dipeptide/oligopeptide/nickel transport system permease component